MKTKILMLIITAVFISSCKEKPRYYKYFYIADSLHFPMETGDTAIFSCSTEDSVIYDTFYIVKDIVMYDILESPADPYGNPKTGEYEVEEVYYENSKFNCILSIGPSIKEPDFIVDWFDYYCDPSGKSYISHLVINGSDYYNIIKYNSLCCCDSLHQLFNICFNRQDGLVKFKTIDKLTFELYAYKKLQCGNSK